MPNCQFKTMKATHIIQRQMTQVGTSEHASIRFWSGKSISNKSDHNMKLFTIFLIKWVINCSLSNSIFKILRYLNKEMFWPNLNTKFFHGDQKSLMSKAVTQTYSLFMHNTISISNICSFLLLKSLESSGFGSEQWKTSVIEFDNLFSITSCSSCQKFKTWKPRSFQNDFVLEVTSSELQQQFPCCYDLSRLQIYFKNQLFSETTCK